MAGDEERIDILARMIDEVSRPARTAAASVDHLGDEATQTAAELEVMDKAQKKASRSSEGLRASMEREARAARAQRRELAKGSAEAERFTKSAAKMVQANDNGGNSFKRNTKNANGFFNVLKKITKWFWSKKGFVIKWGLIAGGVRLLGGALRGLGAAGYAAIAGLTPLSGMLIAYPSIIGGVVQSMATFKIATSGMSKAWTAMITPGTDPKVLAKDMQGLTKSQIGFLYAMRDQRGEVKKLKNTVSGKFFAGLDGELKNMANLYLPILNKELGDNATAWNKVIKFTTKWMTSQRGRTSLQQIMKDNNYMTLQYGESFSRLGFIMTKVLADAGPMLRHMSRDFNGFTKSLNMDVNKNEKGISRFFRTAYRRTKETVHVLGDLSVGLINIGKATGGMQNYLGGGISGLSKDFRDWTSNKQNQQKMEKFFTDSIPIVQELGYWVRDLTKAAVIVTGGPGQFVDTSKRLRTEVLPELAKFIGWFSGGSLKTVNTSIDTVAKISQHLPSWSAGILGVSGAIITAYHLLNKIGGGGMGGGLGNALLRKVTGGKLGVVPVTVMNWPPGFGGGSGGGGGVAVGGGGGAAKAAEKEAGIFAKIAGSKFGKTKIGAALLGGGGGVAKAAEKEAGIFAKIAGSKFGKTKIGAALLGGGALLGRGLSKIPGAGKVGGMLGKGKGLGRGFMNGGKSFNAGWLALSLASMTGVVPKQASRTANYASWGAWGGPAGMLAGAGAGALADTYHAGDDTKKVLASAQAALKSGDINKMKTAQQALLAQSQKLATGGGSQNINRAVTFLTGRLGEFESLNSKLQTEVRLWQSKATQARHNRHLFGVKPNKAPKTQPTYDAGSYGKYGSVWHSMGVPTVPKALQKPAPSIPDFMKVPKNVQASVDNLGHSADISKMKIGNLKSYLDLTLRSGGVVKIDANTDPAMQKVQALATAINTKLVTGFGLFGGGLFTGGATQPGKKYMTGEFGPEAWVSKSGAIKMLGTHGPEMASPGAGAVIPASLTSNPFGGNRGLAPDWAVEAFQGAVAGYGAGKMRSGVRTAPAASQDVFAPNVRVDVQQASADIDVERAVRRAIKGAYEDFMREKKERS